MLTLRPSTERGNTKLNWLDSWHTFSFDQYRDPQHMNFGPLRVINEDWIGAGGGFGTHPHRDMEIITYVVKGQLRHQDSLGNGSIISAGEIQKMSAGTGILHSEFNASDTEPVHLLQIWIVPEKSGLTPAYEQESFSLEENKWKLLGAPNGTGLISIKQNVKLYGLSASKGSTVEFTPGPGSQQWVQLIKGECDINGTRVKSGDGLAIRSDGKMQINVLFQTELLLFELTS